MRKYQSLILFIKKESQKDKLKDILKAPKKKNTSRSSTTETSILEKIRK